MMGFDWAQRDQAVYRLRRMILCLEALRVIDDRLSKSLTEIKEARETMLREMTETRQVNKALPSDAYCLIPFLKA